MFEMRHQARRRALLLWPVSVSVLLAFAFAPALAQAGDSSGVQYSDAPPTVTGKKPSQPPATSSGAGGAGAPGQSATTPGSSAGGSGGKGSSSGESGGAAAGKGGSSGPGGGSGGGAAGKSGISGGQAVGATPTSRAGSSPLVPILIALAILAAISIGAVLIRRRRQGGGAEGSSVTPEAG